MSNGDGKHMNWLSKCKYAKKKRNVVEECSYNVKQDNPVLRLPEVKNPVLTNSSVKSPSNTIEQCLMDK